MVVKDAVAVEARDPATTEKLAAALKVLAEDTKVLLAATADRTGQEFAQARARVDHSLARALSHVGDAQRSALASTRAFGHSTDAYVRAHRWEVLAASAAAGFVVGALLVRRKSSEV